MSLDIAIETEWADGTYRFRLGFKELAELQAKTGVGISKLFRLLGYEDDWNEVYVAETIRLGLIGGGTPALDAKRLTKTYVEGFPLATNAKLAFAIAGAVMYGVKAATDGKKDEAAQAESETTRTAPSESTTPPSTEA